MGDVTAAAEEEITAADLAPYKTAGLEYEEVPNGFLMHYNGNVVHSLFDPVTCTWFASSLHGYDLGSDRVDLEAVYTDGRLSGLTVLPEQHDEELTQTACVTDSSVEEGRTFDEIFAAYESFGLTFRRILTPEGATGYNLFLDGKPVNQFTDAAPSGSVFSFESADPVSGGLTVRLVYNGSDPVRIEKV